MSPDPVSSAVALRSIRPPEAPFAGELITGPLGPRYRVPVSDATERVWSAAPGGHLLSALDVDRVDGSDVLELPRLVARIDGAGVWPGPDRGRAVTLVVSVLRGAVEAAGAAWDDGEWWLTVDGRPVLAPVGGRPWNEASQRIVSALPEAAIDADLRRRVLAVLGEPDTIAATAPEVEELVFEMAEPRALDPLALGGGGGAGDAHPAAGTGRVAEGRTVAEAVAVADAPHAGTRSDVVLGAVRSAVRGLVDDAVAARAAAAWRETRSRLGRRAPLVAVAVVVAAVVSAAGLVVTSTEDGGDAHAGESRAVTHAETPDTASETPTAAAGGADDASTEVPAGTTSTDPEASADAADPDAAGAAAVIEALSVCWRTGEPGCRADVLERPDASIPDGVVLAEADRSVVLLDDLGGVEVVRVEDRQARTSPQIAVIVVHEDRRLVRDVYDVADQP